MLNEEICELREKLNESIANGEDYMVTYKLSIELDELIAKYYRNHGFKETRDKLRNRTKENREKINIKYLATK